MLKWIRVGSVFWRELSPRMAKKLILIIIKKESLIDLLAMRISLSANNITNATWEINSIINQIVF